MEAQYEKIVRTHLVPRELDDVLLPFIPLLPDVPVALRRLIQDAPVPPGLRYEVRVRLV